jgi:hypothetical protein
MLFLTSISPLSSTLRSLNTHLGTPPLAVELNYVHSTTSLGPILRGPNLNDVNLVVQVDKLYLKDITVRHKARVGDSQGIALNLIEGLPHIDELLAPVGVDQVRHLVRYATLSSPSQRHTALQGRRVLVDMAAVYGAGGKTVWAVAVEVLGDI